MDKLPIKLGIIPIVETILEIRFTSDYPPDAVFGLIYKSLQPQYGNFKLIPQPILRLPQEIRDNESAMRFQPYYHLQSKDHKLVIGIGAHSIIFSNRVSYLGWKGFRAFALSAVEQIVAQKNISTIDCIGLRYINVLKDAGLFGSTNLVISLNEQNVDEKDVTALRIERSNHDGSRIIYQLNNNVQVKIGNGSPVSASMIDIDTLSFQKILMSGTDTEPILNEISDKIEILHDNAKKAFFGILEDSFLKDLMPVY